MRSFRPWKLPALSAILVLLVLVVLPHVVMAQQQGAPPLSAPGATTPTPDNAAPSDFDGAPTGVSTDTSAVQAGAGPSSVDVTTQPQSASIIPRDARAEEAAIDEIRLPAAHLRSAIDALEKDVETFKDDDAALARQRVEINALISGSDLFLESLQPRYQAVNTQIQKLGAAPGKDDPPEAADIAAERLRLNRLAAEIDGAIRSTGLVQYRARELLSRVQEHRTRIFATELFRRSNSPLLLETWRSVGAALPAANKELSWILWRLNRSAQDNYDWVAAIAVSALVAYVVLAWIRRRVFHHRLDAPRASPPDYFERAGTAGWVAALQAAPGAAALAILCLGLDWLGLWFLDSDRFALTVLPAGLVWIGVWALARAILQPNRPKWRLVDLDEQPARALTSSLTMIGAVYALDMVVKEVVRILAMPLSVSVAVAVLTSLALVVLLVRIVRTRFSPAPRPEGADEEPSDALTALPREVEPGGRRAAPVSMFSPRLIKIPLLAMVLFILATSLSGYVALGRFVAGQVIVTGSIVVLALLLHLAIRALFNEMTPAERALERVMHDRLGLDGGQTRLLSQAAGWALDGILVLLALPLVLLTWGVALPDTLAWLNSLVFGFEIGQVRISLARIVTAIAIFAALLFATRLVQRWMDARVLSSSRLDSGVANSIHKAVGYAGFGLAVLLALSYSGIDFTNLAIVAGALSVGIGFGLQSIFNNFVSGLILLIERPIKVGDLVVVNNQWGRVRNIAVRSTEIETADRATLIVPNSELIASTVTNWTHRNALARVTIRVSVSYDSDPDQVRTILERVAAQSQIILQQPKPDVVFENFGADGLQFALHTVVPDIARSFAAQTELRTAITKEFRAAGIEIPFAQHDIHLRDLDFLRTLLQRVQQERTVKGGGPEDQSLEEDGEGDAPNGTPGSAGSPA
jgi:small-conductance mechanosensitive channel